MIIDSPGYGFVFAPIALKKKWRSMMFKYLGHAVRLNLVLLLVNANIGLKQNDIEMIEDL
jgi:GTP-binding protein EngB required for normal cell division